MAQAVFDPGAGAASAMMDLDGRELEAATAFVVLETEEAVTPATFE